MSNKTVKDAVGVELKINDVVAISAEDDLIETLFISSFTEEGNVILSDGRTVHPTQLFNGRRFKLKAGDKLSMFALMSRGRY